MRIKLLAVLAILSVLPLAAQESSNLPIGLKLDGLKIPVELSKGIKSEKAREGDPVELRMAEAVLVGHGLIIPDNAKLHGHVLGASGAEDGKKSHLSVLVDRAEWKGHSLPLHAVIDGFGTRRLGLTDSTCVSRTAPQQSTERRGFLPENGPSISLFDCQEDRGGPEAQIQRSEALLFSTITMYRSSRGDYSVLLSKKNIHLHSGILMMLKNTDVASVSGSEGSK